MSPQLRCRLVSCQALWGTSGCDSLPSLSVINDPTLTNPLIFIQKYWHLVWFFFFFFGAGWRQRQRRFLGAEDAVPGEPAARRRSRPRVPSGCRSAQRGSRPCPPRGQGRWGGCPPEGGSRQGAAPRCLGRALRPQRRCWGDLCPQLLGQHRGVRRRAVVKHKHHDRCLPRWLVFEINSCQ